MVAPRAKSKLVYGVGRNDSDTPVFSSTGGNITWVCPFYEIWKSMLQRCYSAKKQKRFPTYVGCSVVDEWLLFSNFKKWMESQSWRGNHIDKDILAGGCKEYGPRSCVFISPALNQFLTDRGACRGGFPIGVTWNKQAAKFKAQCRNPFSKKLEFLGYFSDSSSAHEAWRARKHELACRYADMQTDHRVADALRKRYAGQSEQENRDD